MNRTSGFTLIEIVIVLLLMGILAAAVLGRSVTTSNLELNAAADKVRNQLRFAQAEAMKQSDAVWGIQSDDNDRKYWIFRATDKITEEVVIPGGDYASGSTRIGFADLGADLNRFTVVFDRLGRPYKGQTNGIPNTPVTAGNNLVVTVSKGETRSITITPETGLIQ